MAVKARVAVIGMGYVGLVTAVGLAKLRCKVFCVERDASKAASLRRGEVPFYEPGLKEAMDKVGDLIEIVSLEEAVAQATLILIAVGTPGGHHGDFNMEWVRGAIDDLLEAGLEQQAEQRPIAVVMKSTVRCGTAEELRAKLPDAIDYISCPEFLREGSALPDFLSADRVVIGELRRREAEGQTPADLLDSIMQGVVERTGGRVLRMSAQSAELVKLASNSLLAVKITFANELANLCDELGVDYALVLERLKRAGHINTSFLRPGLGFGGSCFPKDVAALEHLADEKGRPFVLLRVALQVNARQPIHIVNRLDEDLDGGLQGRRVAVLGLTFKPGTSDLREGSSFKVMAELLDAGVERIVACDPHFERPRKIDEWAEVNKILDDERVRVVEGDPSNFWPTIRSCVRGAHVVVLATEWSHFGALDDTDWSRIAGAMDPDGGVVLDGRNAFEPSRIRGSVLSNGEPLRYGAVGRRAADAEPAVDVDALAEDAAEAFLAIKREFVDRVKELCPEFHASFKEVADGMALDARIDEHFLLHHADAPPADFDEAVARLLARADEANYPFDLLRTISGAAA